MITTISGGLHFAKLLIEKLKGCRASGWNAPAQLKQLVSCSKCGADRNNCALSRRNWTRAKKRRGKSARSIWSMIRRLNPMKDKNRIAAAKQVNDSRVRHFSRATDFSNAFQNVR
jgi:hypothetical protein